VTLRLCAADAPAPLPELCRSVAALRRHACEWPFLAAARAVAAGRGAAAPPAALCPRPGQPTLLLPRADQLVVVLALAAGDATERALLRVVAQELAEAKAGGGSGGAPSVVFCDRPEALPPDARRALQQLAADGGGGGGGGGAPPPPPPPLVGYLTVTCFLRHVATPAQAAHTAGLLAGLRYYLDYHAAASKTYMANRLRARLEEWQAGLAACARAEAPGGGGGGGGGGRKG
jgi:hypothetical protein